MKKTMDGNTAAAMMAYRACDFAAIYPITPSSTMAELCDEWQSQDVKNIFGNTMKVVEMQSEAGAAGALHGALLGGAIATTFTASQGLLLMIPNMYKIAGELLPCAMHVSARTLATHALNIFGDHSDVMACRTTGFAMLCSSNVQEAMDFALLAHISTLQASVPFLHFFDGFRTSHEIQKIDVISDDIINLLMPMDKIEAFRNRALNPDNPKQCGTAQNPDVFFQNREACNKYYNATPSIVAEQMKKLGGLTGRKYDLFDYVGANDAEVVIVMMGSGSETCEEVILAQNALGAKFGLLKIRLFRPFSVADFASKLPNTVKTIITLDRVKESGAIGEPIYMDVISALNESGKQAKVLGGRYGLGGKDFTPSMMKAVLDNAIEGQKNHFTVGITDDVTNTSLICKPYSSSQEGTEFKFYGLGSDGTVSANKNSIKIIGENTDLYCQGYFEYDSKKSGSLTISHLRTSKNPIKSTYLVEHPNFVACHNLSFLSRYDVLDGIKENGTFLLNCKTDLEHINKYVPNTIKEIIIEKNIKFYAIDAEKIATECGLKNKINTVMQSAFFKISNVIDVDIAISYLKNAAEKSYKKKGEAVLNANYSAIDRGGEYVTISAKQLILDKDVKQQENAVNDDYYQNIIKPIVRMKGGEIKVSAFDATGSVPTGTSHLEKRCIATMLPKWISQNCIQCNMCALSCPHATIRPILQKEEELEKAPDGFITRIAMGANGCKFRVQINPKDCTGCGVCANVCPTKNKALEMVPVEEIAEQEGINYDYSLTLKENEKLFPVNTIKGSQLNKPLFEFSGACAGCGETPYIKLISQLFGEKMIIANATGCSSIYGGSCPTCPYTKTKEGKGIAWANSLFEDNAEFGLGITHARKLTGHADNSIWIVGGDGWAYDIGYGGLDHVLASGENVNILVLDTEVYSNTGGQSSKSTPRGATAKFAMAGKRTQKKPLASIAMAYGDVYVAQISLGGNMQQAIKALTEAEKYKGVSLIIAYSPCINHGIDMSKSSEEMKKAVECGYFNLFRYNPDAEEKLSIDSKPVKDYMEFISGENRFMLLEKTKPELAKDLFEKSKQDAIERYNRNKKED